MGLLASTYRMRKLGGMLRDGTAWIQGRVHVGDQIGRVDDPLAWLIYDVNGLTHHVLCEDRPSWVRYAPAE